LHCYREKNFKQSLAKLREEVVKANALVREANQLSQEMGKQTEFHVTLQIPAANLSPNRRVCSKINFILNL
jgi:kinesin family protein 13